MNRDEANRPLTWVGRRRIWWWVAAAVLLSTAVLAAREEPARLGIATLRVGIDPAAMPRSTGERDYVGDGLDAYFAQDLAQHLGIGVALVPLDPAQQRDALVAGRVDVLLKREGESEAADRLVRRVPTGLASGLSVAMRSDTTVREWSNLSGRVVCTTQGNARAQARAAQSGGRVRLHVAAAQALAQVRTGACDAAVFDQAQLAPLLARPEWAKFSATLPARDGAGLVLMVLASDTKLASALEAAVATVGTRTAWQARASRWAANVAYEVYFDQIGPDCH